MHMVHFTHKATLSYFYEVPQFKEVLGKTQQGPVPFATEVGHSILYFPFAQNPDQLSWCDSADSVSVRQNKKPNKKQKSKQSIS